MKIHEKAHHIRALSFPKMMSEAIG